MKKNGVWRIWVGVVVAVIFWGGALAFAQAPVISSFGQNGVLVATNLAPGTVATVEWASSANGPWSSSWSGLESVTADAEGRIQVGVPMFYRVRGTPAAQANMSLIPAGSFTMGDAFTEGAVGERPTHVVFVSAFYMDRHEVTKALWDEVYQWALAHGYSFDNAGGGKAANHPAHTMSWHDAVKWCNARSEKAGLAPAYYTSAARTTVYRSGQIDLQNDCVNWSAGYRLPTEAEWEKAARGGTSGRRFPWADGDTITHARANYSSDAAVAYDLSVTRGFHPDYATGGTPYTSPVGSFASNAYGLFDMAGNQWEWVWDWATDAYYGASPGTDPRGPASGVRRANRGGGWSVDGVANLRVSRRGVNLPTNRWNNVGFRCALGQAQP